MILARQKLPPFAKLIDQESDLVMIYCGTMAWKIAPPEGDRVASLLYPKDADPALYRWPVKNKRTLVMGGDEDAGKIQLLIVELLRQGASAVHLYQNEQLVEYERPES